MDPAGRTITGDQVGGDDGAEGAVRAVGGSAVLWHDLAERSVDAILVCDPDGTCTWASPSLTEVSGWGPADWSGRPVADFLAPGDEQLLGLAEGAGPEGRRPRSHVRIVRADGSLASVSVSVAPRRDGAGAVESWVLGLRDESATVDAGRRLASSEASLRVVADNVSDVVVTSTPEGWVVAVSDAVEGLLGWHPDEMAGRPMIDFVSLEDRATILEAQRRLMAGDDEQLASVVRLRTRAGGARWVSVQAHLVRDPDGGEVRRICTWRDAEAAVEARDALLASEERFHVLADNATDVVAVSGPDRRIEWVSPGIEAALGWRPEDLVGHLLFELVHPDDRPVLEAVRARFEAPGGAATPQSGILARMRTASGDHRWMSGKVSVTCDPQGGLQSVIAGMRDVDDLVRARETAQAEQQRLQATLDSMLDRHMLLVAIRDETGAIVDFGCRDANPAACAFNRMSRQELVQTRLLEVVPGHGPAGLVDRYAAVIETGEPLILDDFLYDHEAYGAERRFDVRAVKVGDALSYTWRDVTERHEREEQLAELTTRDPLTSLANRAALLDDLARALSADRRAGTATALLMLDLDRFTFINESLGHAVGDDLLQQAAARVTAVVRAEDLVARTGGDEFVVVLREVSGAAQALAVAQALIDAFRSPLLADGHDVYSTASVGIAISTRGAGDTSGPDLLREADTALHRAKTEGRDRSSLFNEDLRLAVTDRIHLEADLRRALRHGELAVWYQPEVDLRTGQMVAVEALLRWHHPSGQLYTADRFIHIAEDTGLILEIGERVVDEACRQAASWQAARPAQPLTVRVNLSALQFASTELLATIDRSLHASGVDVAGLCMELTETILLRNTETVRANFDGLRDRGVAIAVDDFGTGFASLVYLRDYPVNLIKIDRSFVTDLVVDDKTHGLVAGIVALAHRLGMTVTAEGVEHAGQARTLRELGCHGAQGFLFSRAVPAEQIGRLLEHRFPVH